MSLGLRTLAFGAVLLLAGSTIALIVVAIVIGLEDGGEPAARVEEEADDHVAATPELTGTIPASFGLTVSDMRELGFDVLPAVQMPPDNPISPAKVELGKLLFFDPRMSNNSAVSCATCHQPQQGWGDGIDISFGYTNAPHWRNTQTILNSVFHPKLFWAGESLSLEAQAKSAWTGALAQNLDSSLAEERLRQMPAYVERFEEVFGAKSPTFADALRAVAAFESTIVSENVPFDAWMRGDEDALSDSAKRGMELFVGKARCSACHSGPLFTNQSYHALGVPENPKFETDPMRQIALRYQHRARGVAEEEYRKADGDLGLFYTTKQEQDKGKFRTPTLREVAQTGPYMHNGVFKTLEEVVRFYNEGGGETPNKSPLMAPLGLTDAEITDLVAFMEALTGDPVIVEPPELPEYEVLP